MKIKPKKTKDGLPPVTAPPPSVKHRYRVGDFLHIGLDTLHICQVDYSAGEVYYSVSYTRKGAKRPRWGWVFAALLDDLTVTKTDPAKPQKKAFWRHEMTEDEDDEPVVVKVIK